LVMLVCSSSQGGHRWLTPFAIPTKTSWILSSGSLIYRTVLTWYVCVHN
jgi:hypothetical protein